MCELSKLSKENCHKSVRCEKCPLSGTIAVGSRGNIDAPFVFVGEAPAIDELRTGKPFTGKSGQLFEKVARAVKIDLSEENAFITNALYCPQPTIQKTGVDRKAIIACNPRLHAEISAYPRKLIVLMGATALKSFVGDLSVKITRERGKVFDTNYGPAIAVLHPAAILRNTKEMRTFFHDFQYISELMAQGSLARKTPGIVTYDIVTESNVDYWLQILNNAPKISADIETSGFNAYKDRILCLGIAYEKNRVVIFPEYMLSHLESGNFLERASWHNGKFDTKFLAQYGINVPIADDVMLMHYVTDERPGTHDLKQLASNFLGAENYESKIKPYIEKIDGIETYSTIPETILYEYLANDCDVTYQLHDLFQEYLCNNDDYKRHYQLLIRAANFLRNVENNGMYVDTEYLHVLSRMLNDKIAKLESDMLDLVDIYWNPELYVEESKARKVPKYFNAHSSKQMKWLLYSQNALGLSVPKGFPENTAEATLQVLPKHEIIETILDLRGMKKTKSTYVNGIYRNLDQSPDQRIHPTFNLHTVETGRLSAAGPNVQNFTRGELIRNIIRAQDGNILIEADFSQAELRCLAWYSNDSNLIDIYTSGRDLHDEVAEDFHPGWSLLTDQNLKREQRVDAKTINFGIPYGKKAYSISRERGISEREAQEYINKWFARFPKAEIFLNNCERIGIHGGTLRTPFGRYRRFTFVTNENRIHVANEARNFPIQSLASDLTLLSAMDMYDTIKGEYHGKVINVVHDSILLEIPDDKIVIQEVRDYVAKSMSTIPDQYIQHRVPFVADTKIGYRWGSMHE